MNQQTAIETRYADRRFRSRLEARWAVFFDRLGIPWDYEVQGYETSVRRYLPDYLITMRAGMFDQVLVEVKGEAGALDIDLMQAVAAEVAMPVLILGPLPKWTRTGVLHWLVYPTPGESSVVNAFRRVRAAYEAASMARFEHGEAAIPGSLT